MKAVKIESVDGNTEITVETRILMFKIHKVYRTSGILVSDFYRWVKLPNKTIVSDSMSYQLDEWKRSSISP